METLILAFGSIEAFELCLMGLGITSTALCGKFLEKSNTVLSNTLKIVGGSVVTLYTSTKVYALVKYIILMFFLF